MAVSYEQAADLYLAEALARSAELPVDSPNRDQSQYKRGIWHLHNFDGMLIARVGKDYIRIEVA